MSKISDWQPDAFEINMGDMMLSVVDANEYLEDIRTEMHFHSTFEFQYARKDVMNIRADGETYLINEGEYVIVPPNCFHSSQNFGAEKYALLFSVNFLPKVTSDVSEYRHYNNIFGGVKHITARKNFTVTDCVNRLIKMEKDEMSVHKMKILFGMLFMAVAEDLASEFHSAACENAGGVNETVYKQKLRGIVGDYISRFCNEDDILASVAQILHMSERNTSRIIKDIFGIPLSALVLKQRMSYAEELILKGDLSLLQVSEKVGYKHYNTFYKAFKKHFGISPEKIKGE